MLLVNRGFDAERSREELVTAVLYYLSAGREHTVRSEGYEEYCAKRVDEAARGLVLALEERVEVP